MMEQIIQDVISKRRLRHYFGAQAVESHSAVILPGSFNPIHVAHRQLAALAKQRHQGEVHFELSVTNVDKKSLTVPDIKSRLGQFASEGIWLTNAPTFRQKAMLFPNATFVVGADTAIRLFHQKYYSEEREFGETIDAFLAQSTRFLVFGRAIHGKFIGRGAIDIPPALTKIFDFVDESEFRMDISSSEIRSKTESDSA